MTDNPTKYFFRQRQQNRLYDVVVGAVEEAAARDGVRKKDIANTLGVPPSQVTRWLSGPGNWTSDTTSDLLFSVGAELDFHVVRFCDRAKGNAYHPVGEPVAATLPTATPAFIVSGTASTASTASVVVRAESEIGRSYPVATVTPTGAVRRNG